MSPHGGATPSVVKVLAGNLVPRQQCASPEIRASTPREKVTVLRLDNKQLKALTYKLAAFRQRIFDRVYVFIVLITSANI